ncbi:MAG: carbohydrate kinase [Synechococcaceae bacterium WB9_2_170]|nr:carbohydrate kinase [Synechococcaceae bacterium WB9_2_170]
MALASGSGQGPPPQVVCFGEALVDRLDPPDGDRLGALARLGTPSTLVGRLGCDAIGEQFVQLLAARGVNTTGLQWDPLRPSRIVLVQRDSQGERRFGGFAGDRGQGFADQAVDGEALAGVIDPLLAQAQWLLVGTIPLASRASAQALALLMQKATARGVPLAVDVNWRPTFWDPAASPATGPSAAAIARMRPLLEQATLLKCAAEEARWLFGSADPERIAAALPQRPMVLVSDGAQPLRWCWGAITGNQRPFAIEVVDSTGAGDALMAGVLHRLCQLPQLGAASASASDAEIQALMRFASACGALVCAGAGAIDPQPSEAEVLAFLRSQAE